MAKYYKTIIIITFLSSLLFAQYDDIKFERVSVDQGFSESVVNCILQDHKGFMWFGTHNGLIKYDGYKFIYLNNKNNKSGLNIHNVLSICQSAYYKKNVLWIGSAGGGLNKLNLDTAFLVSLSIVNWIHEKTNKEISKEYILEQIDIVLQKNKILKTEI